MGACCFVGHQPHNFRFGTDETHPECLSIKRFLRDRSEYLIRELGVTHFYSGGAVGVGMWAMEEIIALQGLFPYIALECVLSHAGMVDQLDPSDRNRFSRIQPYLSDITVLSEYYFDSCVRERNEFMVGRSQFVIAVWTGEPSSTDYAVNYARKRQKTVFCMEYR